MNSTTQEYITGNIFVDSGPEYDDTQSVLAKYNFWKISKLKIIHDEKYLIGLQVYYKVPGVSELISSGMNSGTEVNKKAKEHVVDLPDDEYIIALKMYSDQIINGIKFKTSKGKEHRFKSKLGKEIHWDLPKGYHFNLFKFCTNGHVHQLKAYYQPIPYACFDKRSGELGGNNYYLSIALPKQLIPQRSSIYGSIKNQTQHFDDFQDYLSKCTTKIEIASITVYHDVRNIFGIELTYKINNIIYSGAKNVGSDAQFALLQKSKLELSSTEFITGIQGYFDSSIRNLRIQTNTGRVIEAGCQIPPNFQHNFTQPLIAVGGGYTEFLDNIYFYSL